MGVACYKAISSPVGVGHEYSTLRDHKCKTQTSAKGTNHSAIMKLAQGARQERQQT